MPGLVDIQRVQDKFSQFHHDKAYSAWLEISSLLCFVLIVSTEILCSIFVCSTCILLGNELKWLYEYSREKQFFLIVIQSKSATMYCQHKYINSILHHTQVLNICFCFGFFFVTSLCVYSRNASGFAVPCIPSVLINHYPSVQHELSVKSLPSCPFFLA